MLTTLADFTELRGDHAASIAALEEAVSLGRELSAWGDLSYVEARLAIIRARTGDLARARVDLDRADLSAAERGAKVNIDRWVTFMRAELDWLAGDFASVARCCSSVLAVRGAFDESSPDAPQARAAASAQLGAEAFDAAYRSTAGLGYETALALTREALSSAGC